MTEIAILGGTGSLGSALARRWAKAGHTIWIGSRTADKARAAAITLQNELPGAQLYGAGLTDAAEHGAIIVLAVPYSSHEQTLVAIREHCDGKVVVDTTVPLRPRKVGSVQLPAAGSAAVEAQCLLGDRAIVVSALQTVSAEELAGDEPLESDVLVAADKAEAAKAVVDLVTDLGLRGLHAGPLANSAASEALTSVLIQLNRKHFSHAGIKITGDAKLGSKVPAAPQNGTVSIFPISGLPLVQPGDNLAELIAQAMDRNGQTLRDGDVIVVAQKVVSKSEGRVVPLNEVTPTHEAARLASETGKDARVVELMLRESQRIMRSKTGVIIARHHLGHVAANAGIDVSNVFPPDGDDRVVLWPEAPDESATRLLESLQECFGARIAVIISDSLGRAWRIGTVGTAIGSAGLEPLTDRRGEADLFGRVLQATVVARADEIAAAASLVIGEAAEATPVAIIRGVEYRRARGTGISSILRPIEDDLFC